jgi:hypothetical protein
LPTEAGGRFPLPIAFRSAPPSHWVERRCTIVSHPNNHLLGDRNGDEKLETRPLHIAAAGAVLLYASMAVERSAAQVLGPTDRFDLVAVNTESTDCAGGFTNARRVDAQIRPTGVIKVFGVPTGKVFILTNVRFRLLSSANSNIQVRLGVPCGNGCMRPLVDAMVLTDSNGQGGTDVFLGNGMVIARGIEICVADVNQSSPNAFATIHGYFAPE